MCVCVHARSVRGEGCVCSLLLGNQNFLGPIDWPTTEYIIVVIPWESS